MTTLDQLIKIGGVVAAGEFTDDGKLMESFPVHLRADPRALTPTFQ